MSMIFVAILALLAVVCFIMFLFIGFWMGRQTQEKEPNIFSPPDKTGGQPLFDEDPYRDALLNREKSEGSL